MQIKKLIREIAEKELIDEVKFIDAGDLTVEHVGNVNKFKNRQTRVIMKGAIVKIIKTLDV